MNQRDKMMILLGQFNAIRFPLVGKNMNDVQAYYDLIDSMEEQYISIIKEIYPDFKE